MSARLPIDWDATFLGELPEDPGISGYPANCGVSGGARILGQVSQTSSIPINRKPRRHLFRRHRYGSMILAVINFELAPEVRHSQFWEPCCLRFRLWLNDKNLFFDLVLFFPRGRCLPPRSPGCRPPQPRGASRIRGGVRGAAAPQGKTDY
jgi:hypothetical protein